MHQCLAANVGGDPGRVARIVLTASGGPFRGRTRAELADVTVDDALAHPTWSMGPKITVDSSTLMNKGLEVIEAHELFGDDYGIGYDDIDVVVHPQSIVHSMVEMTDGSTIAQLSRPRHAPADRVRPGVARPHRHAVRPHRLGDAAGRSTSSRPTSTPSRAWASPTPRAGRAAWPRPCSTPPTRRPSRRSSAGRIPWSAIPDVLNAVLSRHDGGTCRRGRRRDRRRPSRPRGRPSRDREDRGMTERSEVRQHSRHAPRSGESVTGARTVHRRPTCADRTRRRAEPGRRAGRRRPAPAADAPLRRARAAAPPPGRRRTADLRDRGPAPRPADRRRSSPSAVRWAGRCW